MMPIVSILIPCYNAERWVAQAIESALAQTWPQKEVIVVDDGSTDGSLEVIKQFDDRILWETGPNRGGNVARNRLLELAKGEWVQYLDADDYLLPLKIERQISFLQENPDCDVIYSPVLWVRWSEENIKEDVTLIPDPRDLWVMLARWRLPQTGGPLWRRQAIQSVGGWRPNQPCCQEHELYLRLLMSGVRFCYFGECHVAYRDWSTKERVSKRNNFELYNQRLKIEREIEVFLIERNELTPSRLQALNQARFEIARLLWLQNQVAAKEVIGEIKQSQPGFVPEAPAAPLKYRLIYQRLGFEMAERLATFQRNMLKRRAKYE